MEEGEWGRGWREGVEGGGGGREWREGWREGLAWFNPVPSSADCWTGAALKSLGDLRR